MDLLVPIELTNIALWSGTLGHPHRRTLTYFDPSNYNGTVTYQLEVVATNDHSEDLDILIYYEVGIPPNNTFFGPVGSITIPTGSQTAHIRGGSFAPVSGNQRYLVWMPGGDQGVAASDLIVYCVRLLVKQSGATKTRVQFPLTNAADCETGPSYIAQQCWTNSGWPGAWWGNSDRCGIFNRVDSRFSHLSKYTFEAKLQPIKGGGYGEAKLYHRETTNHVDSSLITIWNTYGFDVSDVAVQTDEVDIDPNDAEWVDGDDYELIVFNGNFNGTKIHGSNIYITVTNLQNVETYWRVGRSGDGTCCQRVYFDLTDWTSASVFHEITGYGINPNYVALTDEGSDNNGSVSTDNPVTDSELTYTGGGPPIDPTSREVLRSDVLTITDGNYFCCLAYAGANIVTSHDLVVISAYGGEMPPPVCSVDIPECEPEDSNYECTEPGEEGVGCVEPGETAAGCEEPGEQTSGCDEPTEETTWL